MNFVMKIFCYASLIIQIESLKGIANNVEQRCDTSNCEERSRKGPLPVGKNKKIYQTNEKWSAYV